MSAPVDVLGWIRERIEREHALDYSWETISGRSEVAQAVHAAMADLIEAAKTLRQIQMHLAPWYERGVRQDYARRVGVSETSSRRLIEKAAEDNFDDALANIGSAP